MPHIQPMSSTYDVAKHGSCRYLFTITAETSARCGVVPLTYAAEFSLHVILISPANPACLADRRDKQDPTSPRHEIAPAAHPTRSRDPERPDPSIAAEQSKPTHHRSRAAESSHSGCTARPPNTVAARLMDGTDESRPQDAFLQSKYLHSSLSYKRLERGRFIWPQATSGTVSLSRAQLSMLLEGIDWRRPDRTWEPQMAV